MMEFFMRVRFAFDVEPDTVVDPLTFLGVAQALLELQRLWMFFTYLAYDDDIAPDNGAISEERLLHDFSCRSPALQTGNA
jgi:hypothetical protein